MAEITMKGKAFRTSGSLPASGSVAPDFLLTTTDLSDVSLSDFKGTRLILNIFPSLYTRVCAESIRRFNQMADSLDNTKILCISRDLPFAHERFNAQEGIDNVISLSELRDSEFGANYGLRIMDGPFAGLLARAVIVVDEKHRVIYSEMVSEVGEEPDYEAALEAAGSASGDDAGPEQGVADEVCTKASTGEHARLEDDDGACDDGRAGNV